MPDRDVFSRHIPREWQTAAKVAYGGRDDVVAKVELVRALSKYVKQGGCPGIDEIADIVADIVGFPDTHPYEGARRGLEQASRKYVNGRTEVAVEVARRILAFDSILNPSVSGPVDLDQIRVNVAKRFLIESAMRQISSPSLLRFLEETGDELAAIYLRQQQHARKLLADSSEIGTLARQLLSSPEGDQARIPRLSIPEMTPDEMVSFALTV